MSETKTFAVEFKSTCGTKSWVPFDICDRIERERDKVRSQRNALAASLEYIASAGLTARHCEDEAKKMLALVFEKGDGE
jgi:hypothetical protein